MFQEPDHHESSIGHTLNLIGHSQQGQSIRCRRQDGTAITVSFSGAPLCDAGGTVFGSMSILMDLTEQQALEEQLRQAQKMEAVGQLAGGVAHDFNNLLTIISGYSELLLLAPNETDKTQGFLEQIHKAGEQAATLTRQLLAFGRKQMIQVKELDLNAIVRDLGKMLCRLIGEDIEMVFTLSPQLGRVKADPGQIEQILLNLAANARDAMPNGGKMTIATAEFDRQNPGDRCPVELSCGRYVMLSVSDTGCGMDESTIARIFEPFFTTKEMGKGTGLGLATVYGIVKQSNGHIDVESKLGKGTTFRAYLPLSDALDPVLTEGQNLPPALSGKETVLLVEDENEVRKLIDQALKLSGYKVFAARSGHEALQFCESHREKIDLLVTDVIMPKMNGRQLAEQAISFQANLKVLYISGYTDKILDGQGVLGPRAAFLQKPISPRALALKVREVLDSPI
jgi:signal transduction histidine kinase